MLYAAFEHGSRPLDRAIQYAESEIGHAARAPRPLANHAFLVRVWELDSTLKREAIESVPWRTRRFGPEEKRGHTVSYYRITDADAEQEELIWATAEEMVGKRYSFASVLAALWYCYCGKPVRWAENRRWGFDCIQDVATAVRSAGVAFCGLRPASSLTPCIGEVHAVDAWEWAYEDEVLG